MEERDGGENWFRRPAVGLSSMAAAVDGGKSAASEEAWTLRDAFCDMARSHGHEHAPRTKARRDSDNRGTEGG